jgi:hypothetical protein
MAKSLFGREPKEETTEPSADEVGGGMKRGGHAHHKKHMAMGGVPMMPSPMQRRPVVAARPAMPVMRKHGGKAEGGAEHKAEMKEMHKIEKELKHHEKMKDSEHGGKAHAKHGGHMKHMMKGGKMHGVPGGLLGGVEDKGPTKPRGTGGIEGPGYKRGGKMHKAEGGMAAKGDSFMTKTTMKPKIDVNDKVHEAKQTKSLNTKTGALEGKGYKHGGHTKKHHYADGGTVKDSVAKRYENTMMHDGEKMPTKKGGTGDIKQKPAGYKHGGHVSHHGHAAHHTTHGHDHAGHTPMHKHGGHERGGHEKMEGHPMKHGGHVVTSKMSTHKKAGGKCNY